MTIENELADHYIEVVAKGLDVPLVEKERLFWTYRSYVKDRMSVGMEIDKELLEITNKIRRSCLDEELK